MGCNCGKPKCDGQCGCKSPAVLQINNPPEYITFHKVSVPAAMGDSTTNPPAIGKYKNVLLYYEADQTSWLYSTDGIPTKLTNGITNYEDAINLPQINGHTLLGNQSSSDLGLQGELTAGANIQINDNVISATDTTYTAGDGIEINSDNEISVKIGRGLEFNSDGEIDVSEEYIIGFDTVALMKNADNLIDGSYARTLGYYAKNDGGGALYKIRTITNEDVVDEGSIIAIGSGTLIAELIKSPKGVNVKQFGAKGDGATDDTTRLQQAINIAHSNRQLLFFPKATYLITGSLTIYSNMIIDGGGSTLKGEFNGALMTSSIVSCIEIKNLTFIGAGNDAYTDNVGMSIVSYYSNFHDLTFRSLYKGISLRTDGASGTLVENRIGACTFTACNLSLDLGEANNNKLTDGFLNNIIINSKDSALPAILLGSASGWVIDGVHIYGNCRRGLYALNGFHTQMNNLYIERASEELVFFAAIQTDVNINNITGTITSASGIGIRLSRSSYHPFGNAAKANLNNIHLNVQSAATSSVGISGTDVDLNISNYSHLSESDTFTPVSTNNTNTLSYQPDTYIAKGKLTDRTNSLSYRSSLVSIAYKARVEAGGDKTITIPIDKKLDSYDIIRFKVAILTKTNWNGAIRINYTATVILVNKNNAKSVTVLEENGTSGGFTTTPTYSYDPDIGALTLSYTPSSSDGYGCIFVDII